MTPETSRAARLQADAGMMLEALPSDYDPRLVAEAAAAALGAALGVMIAENMVQTGRAQAALSAYMRLAEEFAFAAHNAHFKSGGAD